MPSVALRECDGAPPRLHPRYEASAFSTSSAIPCPPPMQADAMP
jgi:hypothetical protein